MAARDVAASSTRSRTNLAIDIAMYAVEHDADEIPVAFFSNDEEIAIAKNLTADETLAAAAAVMKALARHENLSPKALSACRRLSVVWHRRATRLGPIQGRGAPRRQRPRPRQRRGRARSPAGRSSDDPDPHLARTRGGRRW